MHNVGGTPQRGDLTNFRAAKTFLRQRFEAVEQIFFVRDSDDLVTELPVLEKEQRRNRTNVVLRRETLVFVHVHFCYLDRARLFARDLVQQRRDHFTRTTPFSPKIDDHRFVVLRQFAVKIGFVEVYNRRIFHD
jgi:hypothetical protein